MDLLVQVLDHLSKLRYIYHFLDSFHKGINKSVCRSGLLGFSHNLFAGFLLCIFFGGSFMILLILVFLILLILLALLALCFLRFLAFA